MAIDLLVENEKGSAFPLPESDRTSDPLDIAFQIAELRRLKDGWLDGVGLAPSGKGLDWLDAVFAERFPGDLSLPYLYPTAEGGVRAEWSFEQQELSLNIDTTDRIGYWHALDLETDADDSRVLNLREMADWTWLTGELRQRVGAGA